MAVGEAVMNVEGRVRLAVANGDSEVDQRLSIAATQPIAVHAERSAFSPGPVEESTSLAADVTAVRRAVRRSLPVWRRWWWSLDPRVFARR